MARTGTAGCGVASASAAKKSMSRAGFMGTVPSKEQQEAEVEEEEAEEAEDDDWMYSAASGRWKIKHGMVSLSGSVDISSAPSSRGLYCTILPPGSSPQLALTIAFIQLFDVCSFVCLFVCLFGGLFVCFIDKWTMP